MIKHDLREQNTHRCLGRRVQKCEYCSGVAVFTCREVALRCDWVVGSVNQRLGCGWGLLIERWWPTNQQGRLGCSCAPERMCAFLRACVRAFLHAHTAPHSLSRAMRHKTMNTLRHQSST